jgi:hypothetical protein
MTKLPRIVRTERLRSRPASPEQPTHTTLERPTSQSPPSPRPPSAHKLRRRAAAGVFGVALAAAGVAGAGTAGASTVVTGPMPSPSAPGTTSTAGLPSAEQLQAALLSPSDVGPTFTPQPSSASPSGTGTSSPTVSGCPELTSALAWTNNGSRIEKDVTYQAGQAGPFLIQSLSTAPKDQVNANYAQAVTALRTCKTLTLGSQGTVLDFHLTPISFGPAPSQAVRMDGSYQGVQLNGYLVINRVGAAEMAFIYLQVNETSPQAAMHYYQLAETKAQQHLGQSA